VGRRLGHGIQRLAHQHGVALGHQGRDRLVAGPRGVGQHGPALGLGHPCRFDDGIVVAAVHPDDPGAEALDRRHAFVADAAVHEDRRLGADQLGALGHRSPVVAVGGAGERHRGGHSTDGVGLEIADVNRVTQTTGRLLEHQAGHDVGPAQRLEAAEPQPVSLVLDEHRSHPELVGEAVEAVQRRGVVVLAVRQVGDRLVGPGGTQRGHILGQRRPAVGWHRVGGVHRWSCQLDATSMRGRLPSRRSISSSSWVASVRLSSAVTGVPARLWRWAGSSTLSYSRCSS